MDEEERMKMARKILNVFPGPIFFSGDRIVRMKKSIDWIEWYPVRGKEVKEKVIVHVAGDEIYVETVYDVMNGRVKKFTAAEYFFNLPPEEKKEEEKKEEKKEIELAENEIRVGNRILTLEGWFVEQNRESVEKIKDGVIMRETEKALLIQGKGKGLWVPKSVIVEEYEIS